MEPASTPTFSLVIATVDRTAELERLLRSLASQTYRRFEVIIVDQNRDERAGAVLSDAAADLPIIHLRSERGVSRARNRGIREARGEIVTFPDDDCWYPPDLLQRAARFLTEHPRVHGVSGSYADEAGRSWRGQDRRPGRVTPVNVWRRAVGFSFFLRREAATRVSFDETLGPGAGTPWVSGEDTDYVVRVLKAGFSMHYEPSLRIHHRYPLRHDDPELLSRAYGYGRGMGRVLRTHYGLGFALYYWLRPVGGAVVETLRGGREARYHREVLAGRLRGWLDGPSRGSSLAEGERS